MCGFVQPTISAWSRGHIAAGVMDRLAVIGQLHISPCLSVRTLQVQVSELPARRKPSSMTIK